MREARIIIRGAGMHPYTWGRLRFSVWLALAAWVFGAGSLELWLQPFPVFPGLLTVFIVASLIYLGGMLLTARHPFFPEIAATSAWRALRRAYYLHS